MDILNKNLTEKKIPRIGISFRIVNAIGYEEKRDAISHDWPKFLEKINPQSFRYFHIAHAYKNGVLLESISRQIGITTFRIFKILSELNISPSQNYNQFLKKV